MRPLQSGAPHPMGGARSCSGQEIERRAYPNQDCRRELLGVRAHPKILLGCTQAYPDDVWAGGADEFQKVLVGPRIKSRKGRGVRPGYPDLGEPFHELALELIEDRLRRTEEVVRE